MLVPSSLMILLVMIPAAAMHIAGGHGAKAFYPIEIGVVMIALILTGPGRYSLGLEKTAEPEEPKEPPGDEGEKTEQ
jgi:uncharacterized membrane protein YphA (DoxX/SURF4 family)